MFFVDRLQTNERISRVQSCINVTCACETRGELLIGESHMHFVGDEAITDPSLTQVHDLLTVTTQYCRYSNQLKKSCSFI